MTEMGVADPVGAARKAMAFMVEKQAMTIAFGEAFAALALMTGITAVFALTSKPLPAQTTQHVTEAH
jgi:DHA2 family multidrug resistance protein